MRPWSFGVAMFGTMALLASVGSPAQDQTPPPGFEVVELAVGGERAATLKAYLRRPADMAGRGPAIVALHGCGGLFGASGRFSARELDWAERWTADGYAVLFPDSFNPRGYREICRLPEASRPIRPRHRARDAAAALAWLAGQPAIDPARIAVVGWSHGGSSALWAAQRAAGAPGAVGFKTAVAFYPGCRSTVDSASFAPGMPLTILIGSADDWTPPEPCRELAQRHPIRLIEYPQAVHGFDAPNTPRQTRSDVGMPGSGHRQVQIGTDPVARAAAITEVRRILTDAFGPPDRP